MTTIWATVGNTQAQQGHTSLVLAIVGLGFTLFAISLVVWPPKRRKR